MKAVSLFLMCALFLRTGALTAQADKASEPSKTKKADDPLTPLLAAIAAIPTWALRLQTALGDMGDAIQRQKAVNAVLPEVKTIQSRLSDLEDLNRKLNSLLQERERRSAVSQKRPASKPTVAHDEVDGTLHEIKASLVQISSAFKQMRVNVQALSTPELTDLERGAEEATNGKGAAVDQLIDELGYSKPEDGPSTATADQLKHRGAALAGLLHQAQDAFGQLHAALQHTDDLKKKPQP